MDNFEYSIQINDRDWEEFYSTAEECGLMQVSLATEELWLSDSEQEDTTNCTQPNKPKFIRISLCPPPKQEPPALKLSEPVVSQSVQTSHRWLGPNDDILSGSEDEEEFGSVTRFLCQKELMQQKKVSEQRIDIPLSTPANHDEKHPRNENLSIDLAGEGLVEYMRTLNQGKIVEYKEDIQQHSNTSAIEKYNTQVELLLGNPRSDDSSNDPDNPTHCSSINGHLLDGYIPGVQRSEDEIIVNIRPTIHEAILSGGLSKDNSFNTEQGTFNSQRNVGEPDFSKHNGLVYYTMENNNLDNACEVATETSVNSSAVEQNVQILTMEELQISQSESLNIGDKDILNTHDHVVQTASTHCLVPVNTTANTWRNMTPLMRSLASNSNTVLTVPEMYDFFFDDVVFLETESNMEINEGVRDNPRMQDVPPLTIEELPNTQSESLNIEVKATSNTHNFVEHTTSVYSQVPGNTTTKAWRNPTPLSQPSSENYRKMPLTLPEMYDFFFDDVSDTVFLETESNMPCKEGIVYTPEMYEYFFLEDDEKDRAKSKESDTSQASCTDLAMASTSSVDVSWPEACEFFFADGPQFGDREGILVRVPSSQAQSATDIIHSLVPKGLKGFTVRRARHRRGQDRSLTSQDPHRTSEESSGSLSGSIAPYVSPSRRNACLVFLAFASWAVKSSDLQSSDGWKTALLANIGAVSAIQYLRKRSRGTWRESPPESGDET